ncbi:MAG TPA: R3H domain-containing nucleic acid-binding protein [Candidatus Paceibacterota bacterium]|nr:R3H domain-containing nucleic acid-binding protein [Candidatus Paceibacterota bacterium]
MLQKQQLQTIEQEARRFFEELGDIETVSIEQKEDEEEATVSVLVKAADPKILIGERGQTLFEIQHLLKLIVRRKIAEPFYLSLDINDYKKNKEEYLRDLAQNAADEVVLLKKPKELPPMAAAERRIIHTALNQRGDVVSESAGEGLDRHVVISLKS